MLCEEQAQSRNYKQLPFCAPQCYHSWQVCLNAAIGHAMVIQCNGDLISRSSFLVIIFLEIYGDEPFLGFEGRSWSLYGEYSIFGQGWLNGIGIYSLGKMVLSEVRVLFMGCFCIGLMYGFHLETARTNKTSLNKLWIIQNLKVNILWNGVQQKTISLSSPSVTWEMSVYHVQHGQRS